MDSLKDCVAIVTGSSSGIGEAIAVLLATHGCSVTITGRRAERLAQVSETIANICGTDHKVLAIAGDICSDEHLEKIVSTTIGRFGKLNILINNAGIAEPRETSSSSLVFDTVIATNLKSAFNLINLCLPHLTATKGCIINVSSIAGMINCPTRKVYGMSKAAMDYMTRAFAIELAQAGVRVNSVNPGATDTEIHYTADSDANAKELAKTRMKSLTPLGRMAKPEEVAKLVVYLVSNDAAFITGSTYVIDGGAAIDWGLKEKFQAR